MRYVSFWNMQLVEYRYFGKFRRLDRQFIRHMPDKIHGDDVCNIFGMFPFTFTAKASSIYSVL